MDFVRLTDGTFWYRNPADCRGYSQIETLPDDCEEIGDANSIGNAIEKYWV